MLPVGFLFLMLLGIHGLHQEKYIRSVLKVKFDTKMGKLWQSLHAMLGKFIVEGIDELWGHQESLNTIYPMLLIFSFYVYGVLDTIPTNKCPLTNFTFVFSTIQSSSTFMNFSFTYR